VIEASQKFRDALRYSHTALTRVWVQQPLPNHRYIETGYLEIVQGSLTISGSRNIQRQGNFVLAPSFVSDLTPLEEINESSRLRVEVGIRFIDGSEEWVTVATLFVQTATMSLGDGTISVTAYDLGCLVDDYVIIAPFAPEGSLFEAIKVLVKDCTWDEPVWDIGPGVNTTMKITEGRVFDDNRWSAVNALAKTLSSEVWAGVDGRWVIRKVDTTYENVCDTMGTGPTGVLISYSKAKDRQKLYNAVAVRWEVIGDEGTTEDSGIEIAVDDDKDSPTYFYGPFGKRPAPEKENLLGISGKDTARSAAESMLAKHKGFQASVDFQRLRNPLLEPRDVIEVRVDGSLHQIHVIDDLELDLVSGAMKCKTRFVREVLK
jgi:hypothetical protein